MVTIEKVPDGEGRMITLGIYGKSFTAPIPLLDKQMERSKDFVLNSNDVILAAYAKSGTHWLWEILTMLKKGKANPSQTAKERLMFSFGTQEDFDKFPSPRIFNTHARYRDMPTSLRPNVNNVKIVYLARNPKDVAVSYYHHLKAATMFDYDGTWNGFYKLFIDGKVPGGSWFDYVVEWDQKIATITDCPILSVYYEDVHKDGVKQIKRIGEFLGWTYSNELYAAIADECTFLSMKENDERLKEQFPFQMSKDGKNFIYRKGKVGDWKNYFTLAQNEEIDQLIKNRLKGTSLTFDYSV